MLLKILKKIFGDKNERDLDKLQPLVEEINHKQNTIKSLTDDDLRERVNEIRADIQKELKDKERELEELRKKYQLEINENKKNILSSKLDKLEQNLKDLTQEVLDSYLVEVFAIVKDTCRRLIGYKYTVRDEEEEWFMIPYDVQLLGAIVLHKGIIAEMATGEGKTLVATLPLFLNALVGHGAHLITVNDYLAQRDSEWMQPIFEFHNLKVGCIVTGMDSEEREVAYQCDVTYGTNSEFGFDYLRDNMAIDESQLVQRKHQYAIIDEVDSVLIDEARTPLIISGPVKQSKNFYKELKPIIKKVVRAQTFLVRRYLSDVKAMLKRDSYNEEELGTLLLKVKRAAPKNKSFLKLMQDTSLKKLTQDYEGYYLRDKKMHKVDEDLFYAVEEKSNSVELTDKGNEMVSEKEPDLFVMEDLDEEINKIENNENLTVDEKNKRKKEITDKFFDKNEKLHNIKQLIKSYSLFHKDVDYVVADGKVLIVDEFTGRMMPGRRFSDGLHQALEAKENVSIEEASQTYATITLQNYFRKYDKLAGMTGTAVTEESEFIEIYDLSVLVIPTNEPISRIDYDDMIYLTKNEKYKAILREIIYWHSLKKPILVGTVSVDVSEKLSRLLRRRNITHNVLNAKHHEKEAEIIKNAGKPGAVTIATNMAGRGTDIKLGKGVVEKPKEEYRDLHKKITEEYPYGRPLDGLHVIGTERHESRRIDRQLRGRSGRQGDPGTSRFYLSMEDDLMRIFGSERIAPMLEKIGLKEGEAITHSWMSKTVSKSQEKVESYNFETRKQLLKYDEVMNQQREIIYSYRRNVLKGYDLKNEILEMIKDTVASVVEMMIPVEEYYENWNYESIIDWFKYNLNIEIEKNEIVDDNPAIDKIINNIEKILLKHYDEREERITSEIQRKIERRSLLSTVDDLWREHLHEMDLLKEGIGLRAYGQKDPLIEYKKESLNLFQDLIDNIYKEVTKKVFTTYLLTQEELEDLAEIGKIEHATLSAFKQSQTASNKAGNKENKKRKIKPRTVENKVGRNDPCPCGSGKKYKKCCGSKTNR